MPRLHARIVARRHSVGRRSGRGRGSVRRSWPWQRDCALDHGEQHRPPRRQRHPAGDRLAGRHVLARGIARRGRLRRRDPRHARCWIIRKIGARSYGRRRVGVWIRPSNIAWSGRLRRRIPGLLAEACIALVVGGVGIVGATDAGIGAAIGGAEATPIGCAAVGFVGGAGTGAASFGAPAACPRRRNLGLGCRRGRSRQLASCRRAF